MWKKLKFKLLPPIVSSKTYQHDPYLANMSLRFELHFGFDWHDNVAFHNGTMVSVRQKKHVRALSISKL